MNLWFRLLWLRWQLRKTSALDLLDEVVLNLRVWPTDLDVQGHVNNGRYLSLMDLGRVALMQRTGLFEIARRERWMPLVRGITIEYFKPLMPGQRFTLHTHLAGWDGKWLHLEQRFYRGDMLCAQARIHGLMRSKEGNVSSERLLEALGQGHRQSPSM